MKHRRYVRWVLLAMGLIAVIGLSGMNVYSLYALHENKVQNSVEKQKRQLLEYTNQVRSRFRHPVRNLWQLDMEVIQSSLDSPSHVHSGLLEIIDTSSRDSVFSEIYFSLPDCAACDYLGAIIWKYHRQRGQFVETTEYNQLVSDGLAMARTRMNALVHEYRWSTRVIFDTQNSMTIALINPANREIIGYLLFVINRDYLINSYMGPKLLDTFGEDHESGIVVWLHDWTKNEVLATTSPNVPYSYRSVDFIQNFPDLLNDWNLKAKFTSNPAITASQATLKRNLIVLGGAVFLLLSTFIFMFITAQRERSLAQRQSLFLANVTHELKTPLSVILAAGENLSDGRVSDPSRLKSYGSHIYNESLRLHNMIDRLLDVARINTQSVSIHKKKTDLAGLAHNYLQKKQGYFESYHVNVHFESEKDLPEILVDQHDMYSILDNLIDNAVKYSPDEKFLGIRIFKNGSRICLAIADQGIGISKESQKYIFDKFYRAEEAMTAHTRGHGLGLSIVKDLIHRNGGIVSVHSVPNKGSEFVLEFPIVYHFDNEATKNAQNNINQQEARHVS